MAHQDPLIRTSLSPGWIDLSIGEARVVRETLNKIHPLDSFSFQGDSSVWEYQHPFGYRPLVDFLQRKHQRKVVITSGAKQGLCAAFYALKQSGKSKIGLKKPYWCQLPPTISMMNMTSTTEEDYDSFLLVSPNNPDGAFDSNELYKEQWKNHRLLKVPYIHDAAYYDPIYFPDGQKLDHIGDMQIYSISKKYGMSGLRLGYVVFDDDRYYNDVMHYVETSTVGASAPAQRMFYEIQLREQAVPELREAFENRVRCELSEAREIVKRINPKVLEPRHSDVGMLGWFFNKANVNFDDIKVKVLDGKFSDDNDMVRINLAVGNDVLRRFVELLNAKYDI